VLAVAKRMHDAWPDDPEAADVLSTGLARAGRLREAIETLHDLSKKHPERDIVLGRIAGLLNFLTDEAATDPKKKADLDAIAVRMKAAAQDPQDLVARFVVATREYYAGKLPEALPQLEALAKTGSRDPRIPLYLAMTHFWLGHQQEAQALIQHAVDIGPSDPDVFYCRSQIVRKVNLPLAIADLQRYEAMTTRPWSVGPKRKAERVEAELAFMKRGELPPDWDKPGPERAPFDPAHQQGTPVTQEVREGRIALPGAVTPVGLQGEASGVAIGAPATGTGMAPPSPSHGPDAPPPGDEEQPWLPIALVVAIATALGVRLWMRHKARTS
jgi:tetratricopeptide (TPR) repeat protein